MKSTIAASATLLTLAAAVPQYPGGSSFSGYANIGTCLSNCTTLATPNASNYASYCTNSTAVALANTCIAESSCSDSDKSNSYQAIAQLCANAGATVTASPEATFSATSGKSPASIFSGGGNGWAAGGGASNTWASGSTPTAWPTAAWSTYPASAISSLSSAFASWTSAASLTARPTDAAQWSSLTSAHPLPTALASANPFFAGLGGSAWPSSWATVTGAPSGRPGWSGQGGYGPFGGSGNGWGPWASESSGAWTTGPWTSWWGTGACPASTWSGWTSGSWSTAAPWTSWPGCTATTTATSVVTSTVTTGGSTAVVTSTGYGIKIAAADATASGQATTTSSGSGAVATNFKIAGSAAGVMGVLAGALLL